MIINGIDVRRYGATLLTAETKPPKNDGKTMK